MPYKTEFLISHPNVYCSFSFTTTLLYNYPYYVHKLSTLALLLLILAIG